MLQDLWTNLTSTLYLIHTVSKQILQQIEISPDVLAPHLVGRPAGVGGENTTRELPSTSLWVACTWRCSTYYTYAMRNLLVLIACPQTQVLSVFPIDSNCTGISGTVQYLRPLSLVPEGPSKNIPLAGIWPCMICYQNQWITAFSFINVPKGQILKNSSYDN